MSGRREERGQEPGKLFAELKDRPTPELESDRLWQRVSAGLTPRRAHWWSRPVQRGRSRPAYARLAYAAATVGVLALGAWASFTLISGGAASGPGEAGQLASTPATGAQAPAHERPTVVRLAPPLPEVVAPTPQALEPGGLVSLDVRLVRGFSGAVPEDVQVDEELAAGGADPLADVRVEVGSLPFDQYGLMGIWSGDLGPTESVEAEISSAYALNFTTMEQVYAGGFVELLDVRLVGEIDLLVASSLRLEPGRLYLLGVREPGEEAPSVILAIRANTSVGGAETSAPIH